MAIITDLDFKIVELLGDLTIDKERVRNLHIREARTVTTFVEEWLVSRYERPDKKDDAVYQEITAFMTQHLPTKTEKEGLKNRIVNGDSVVVLDRFTVRVDVSKGKRLVSIPCLDESRAEASNVLLDEHPGLLSGGQWGAGRLALRSDGKDRNVIELIEFRPMQSGQVRLQALIDARQGFDTEEWLRVLIRTMGYEPEAYSENQRRNLVLRLLPLVQKNLNMMELAPKGTGKSFVFSNLSRHVWLNSGGALTRAQLFKNLSTREEGLLARFDLLVLDEGQSIEFKGESDIHAKFKDYLESGHYTIGHDKITSECGLMVLANIELDYRGLPTRPDFIRQLPEMFHDDALLDRFHGIVAGWKIPRITNAHFAQGPGIKADVFGEYAHQIRTASSAIFPYGQVPSLQGDTRDSKAIERLARALSRLFMLNPEHSDYDDYVLKPAIGLRERVRTQLAALNPSEFSPQVKIEVADH
ncbi:BREX system Lon protease-like protein BrxL [uncultured Lamprocystis sp.]|jgi:ATP-dependent Lon protease|uniref:BREX system Lon protease-like protein BrxL n=1 Tax=uncultured Lamprocystis sp. TaxID=543132 RepID=UPI0025FDF1AE|nr:BREX system Lon protease-like protein BrxL [uncultured Lamprocystis sp.]